MITRKKAGALTFVKPAVYHVAPQTQYWLDVQDSLAQAGKATQAQRQHDTQRRRYFDRLSAGLDAFAIECKLRAEGVIVDPEILDFESAMNFLAVVMQKKDDMPAVES